MKVRYIRESMTGSNSNSGCHWCEIQAINYEGVNVALSKTVTCEGGTYEKGTLDMITNGNTTVDDYIYFRNDAQNTISVTIDLENIEELDNIRVWHYYGGGRTYQNILLEVSLNGHDWTKIFSSNENGEYAESSEGKTHALEDDRLPILEENSSLNEVVYFYEKYIEQNRAYKSNLATILKNKNIEVSENEMLYNLINKVSNLNSLVYDVGDSYILYNDENIETTTSNSFSYFNKEYIFENDGDYRLSASFQYHNPIGAPKIKLLILNNDSVFAEKEFTSSDQSIVVNVLFDVLNVKEGYVFKVMGLNTAGRTTELINAKVSCNLRIM